jgi:hypothetical protein
MQSYSMKIEVAYADENVIVFKKIRKNF